MKSWIPEDEYSLLPVIHLARSLGQSRLGPFLNLVRGQVLKKRNLCVLSKLALLISFAWFMMSTQLYRGEAKAV